MKHSIPLYMKVLVYKLSSKLRKIFSKSKTFLKISQVLSNSYMFQWAWHWVEPESTDLDPLFRPDPCRVNLRKLHCPLDHLGWVHNKGETCCQSFFYARPLHHLFPPLWKGVKLVFCSIWHRIEFKSIRSVNEFMTDA